MKRQSLDRFQVGQLVRSKQGRDKGRLYVVVAKDARFLYGADGEKWTAGCPKKKNPFHVQYIGAPLLTDCESQTDTEIIRIIGIYESRNND